MENALAKVAEMQPPAESAEPQRHRRTRQQTEEVVR